MQVRLANLGDADAIRTIYNGEVTGSTSTFDLVPRTSEDQVAWLRRHEGAHPAVVATDANGTVVGFGSLSSFRDRPAYSTTVENSVYVDPTNRASGVGRALLDELIAQATQLGFHTMIARVVGDNEASLGLHKACGFELIGVEREIGRKFGRWLDCWVLQRML
jgi:L-amino acid N-acyltransferase YncA